jgi:lipopolysaccharide/colanic/teichoic acid biosynthesis glycosyltransferase
VFKSSIAIFEGNSIASESIYSPIYLPTAREPVDSWRYRYVKRGFDLLCALIMIAAFAIPGLLIAAAILLSSEGPVFYREQRIGRDGRPFKIWKFRSMYRAGSGQGNIEGTEQGGTVRQWRMCKHIRDPRITAIGNILRRWSLDELPQLLNILQGQMSLIGPRPIVAAETGFYGNLLPFYLAATPGLSGLWQVSGRSTVDYEKRARLDALYVRSWCLATDFSILFRTIPAVLSRIGAH